MSIVERDVELDWLAGSPRWWTVTNDRGTREVVRAEFSRAEYFPNAKPEDFPDGRVPDEVILYILLSPGQYKHPPLAAVSCRMGIEAFKMIEEGGGEVVFPGNARWNKLELMLVGWKR